MKARDGQEVRCVKLAGTWTLGWIQDSPSAGLCATIHQRGRTRVRPFDQLRSKSGRPLEAGPRCGTEIVPGLHCGHLAASGSELCPRHLEAAQAKRRRRAS